MLDKVILGTVQMGMNYGINNSNGQIGVDDSMMILSQAHSSGIRWLDTAKVYGSAHEIIGAFHERSTPPPFKVITKVPLKTDSDSLYETVLSYVSELRTSHIDILLFHSLESYVKFSSSVNDLVKLKGEGLVKNIGVSVYSNTEVEQLIDDEKIEVIQLPFNMLDNEYQRGNVLRTAKQRGKIIHARSIFLQGLFFMDLDKFPAYLQPLIPYVNQLRSIIEKYNLSLEEAALNYVGSKDYIDAMLIGVDSLRHLNCNLNAINSATPLDFIKEVDEIKVSVSDLLNPAKWNR